MPVYASLGLDFTPGYRPALSRTRSRASTGSGRGSSPASALARTRRRAGPHHARRTEATAERLITAALRRRTSHIEWFGARVRLWLTTANRSSSNGWCARARCAGGARDRDRTRRLAVPRRERLSPSPAASSPPVPGRPARWSARPVSTQAMETAAEEAIVRAVESEAIEGPSPGSSTARRSRPPCGRRSRATPSSNRSSTSIDSELVDQVWARLLESNETELLIKRIAEAPEVRSARLPPRASVCR